MGVQQDIADAATALAAWGERTSGGVTASDWQQADRALSAIDNLADTIGHLRNGLVREIEQEKLIAASAEGGR